MSRDGRFILHPGFNKRRTITCTHCETDCKNFAALKEHWADKHADEDENVTIDLRPGEEVSTPPRLADGSIAANIDLSESLSDSTDPGDPNWDWETEAMEEIVTRMKSNKRKQKEKKTKKTPKVTPTVSTPSKRTAVTPALPVDDVVDALSARPNSTMGSDKNSVDEMTDSAHFENEVHRPTSATSTATNTTATKVMSSTTNGRAPSVAPVGTKEAVQIARTSASEAGSDASVAASMAVVDAMETLLSVCTEVESLQGVPVASLTPALFDQYKDANHKAVFKIRKASSALKKHYQQLASSVDKISARAMKNLDDAVHAVAIGSFPSDMRSELMEFREAIKR